MRKPLAARLWAKVDKRPGHGPDGECWLWTGFTRGGYGRLFVEKVEGTAVVKDVHIIAWEQEHGPVPEGMCVLHRCDTRNCIRDQHLFLGTKGDNNQDRHAKGRTVIEPARLISLANARARTHCRRGHEYTEANTYRSPDSRRHCRTCRAEHWPSTKAA